MRTAWYATLCTLLVAYPWLVLAQSDGFVPLIGIPGLSATEYNIGGYVNALYILAISVAAFLVVAKLILAGFKYMLTDVVPQKEEAKKDIQGALTGLLIVLGAVLILETINPQLTQLNVLNLSGVNPVLLSPRGEGVPDLIGSGQTSQNQSDPTNQPATTRTVFTTRSSAETAATTCGGVVETVRDRRHFAVCPIEPSASANAPIVFNGETIPQNQTFTISDPANPDLGITEAAENDGNQIQIVGVAEDGRITVLDLETQQTYPIGCQLITPPLPGC